MASITITAIQPGSALAIRDHANGIVCDSNGEIINGTF